MKKFKSLVTLMIAITVFCMCSGFTPGLIHVYDEAQLLDPDEVVRLEQIAREKEEEYQISITFLTYDDAMGKSTETYTDDFYDTTVGAEDGLLIAIDMDNREVYINTVGSCIQNISDYEIDDILDDTYTYASDSEWMDFFVYTLDGALYAYTDTEDYYGPAYSDEGYGNGYEHVTSVKSPWIPTPISLVVSVVVMIIVAVVLLIVHNKNNRAPAADAYLESNFEVNGRDESFMGVRHEVIHGFYAEHNTGSGGGGSSHMSGGGISHGGGGHSF